MRSSALAAIVISSLVTCVRGLQQPLPRASHTDARDTPVEIPLEVLQVQAPLRDSYDGAACSQVIVQSDFTASYGSPYVGTYTPPPNCSFTTVLFNMTVTSAGINYDRLTLLYFGDIELWRHTTAMPVRTGIYYTFSKDMTAYMPLLRTQQKVILQLDNIYNSVFTGNFNVTITALYYDDDDDTAAASGVTTKSINPPDAILPISSRSSAQNTTSAFSLPDDDARVALVLPRNAARAVVSVFASGNGNEEFWYADVPAAYLATFGSNVTFANGYGPWREVQVLVDGALAGVAWPETVVFTGGVSTGLWVPIVGADAFDLGSVDVDVSPWLGVLCDGEPHSFELRVVGYNATAPERLGTVAQNWVVSGQVFVWLDEGGNQTTGTAVSSVQDDPVFNLVPALTTYSNGTNSSLQLSLCASRSRFWHTSVITTSQGSRNLTWQQDLTFLNIQNITARGRNETLYHGVWPTTISSPYFSQPGGDDNLSAPANTFAVARVLSFFQAYAPSPDYTTINSTIYALLDSGKYTRGQRTLASLLYPTAVIDTNDTFVTRQNGSSFYLWNNTYYESAGAIDPARGSTGATEQWLSAAGRVSTAQGRSLELYGRHARAVDEYEPVLVADDVVVGATVPVPEPSVVAGGGANVLSGWGQLGGFAARTCESPG